MSYCKTSQECMNAKAQTFCKWDKREPNCYSLYWKTAEHKEICYHKKNDTSCKEDHPVKCGILRPVLSGTQVSSVDFLSMNNSCQGLCNLVRGCTKSQCTDTEIGGYCDGLYWTAQSGRTLQAVVHISQYGNLPDNQRVPCGVYGYTS